MKYVEEFNVLVTEDGKVFRPSDMYQYKPVKCRAGYMSITIKRNSTGRRGRASIHRLVAMAYLPNPENKTGVNHLNGQKDDNRLCNLEWSTRSENLIHAHKVLKKRFGIVALNEFQLLTAHTLKGKWSNVSIAKALNVAPGTIKTALRGSTYSEMYKRLNEMDEAA